jgi:hypothetical protein
MGRVITPEEGYNRLDLYVEYLWAIGDPSAICHQKTATDKKFFDENVSIAELTSVVSSAKTEAKIKERTI